MCGAKSFGIVNRRILTHITPWWREKRERQRVRTWNDSNHREREREEESEEERKEEKMDTVD